MRALALCGADLSVVRMAVLSAMQVSVSAGAGERLEVKLALLSEASVR